MQQTMQACVLESCTIKQALGKYYREAKAILGVAVSNARLQQQ